MSPFSRPNPRRHFALRWRDYRWLLPALAVVALLLAALLSHAAPQALRLTAAAIAAAVCIVGAARILALARLMHRARHGRMAGLWSVFALVTLVVAGLWLQQLNS